MRPPAAAKAAALMLLGGKNVDRVDIGTPGGTPLSLDVLEKTVGRDTASCAVRKDSGDDPDVTNGVLVYAAVRRIGRGIEIDGGEGVGRVTRPGLDQPVGAAAINSVPRRMIGQAVGEAMAQSGYAGGLSVVISIPDGVGLAARTFNPGMGIAGGIGKLFSTHPPIEERIAALQARG